MFTPANLFAQILFSCVGMGAFIRGKRNALWKPLVIGMVLMLYPYFVSETWALYIIGAALCVCLFLFRE